VCAAIVLPWYLHQYYTWGQAFMDQHFRNQMVGRFESSTFGASPWYAYLKDIFTRYWWFPLGLFGGYHLCRQPAAAQERHRAWDRFHIVWAFGAIVILHLLPKKYDRYLLLVYPAFAILVAYGIWRTRFWESWRARVLPHVGWISLVVMIIVQFSGVRLHSTAYPELAQALPAINNAPGAMIYAAHNVPMPLQCSIRFFSRAKVLVIGDSQLQKLRPDDILVIPRQQPLKVALPPHRTIAEGRQARILSLTDG